ncbi:hypothetical protein BGX38DRAFT_1260833 [Terfezia claveryi]|nr:hypothetical protein BGX38DRAFT_1260833 [Terfezia claveryi]
MTLCASSAYRMGYRFIFPDSDVAGEHKRVLNLHVDRAQFWCSRFWNQQSAEHQQRRVAQPRTPTATRARRDSTNIHIHPHLSSRKAIHAVWFRSIRPGTGMLIAFSRSIQLKLGENSELHAAVVVVLHIYAWVEIRCYSVSGDAHITQAYEGGCSTRPAKRHPPVLLCTQPVDPTSGLAVLYSVWRWPPFAQAHHPGNPISPYQSNSVQAGKQAAILTPSPPSAAPACTRSLHAEAYVQLAARIIIFIELCTPPEPAPDLDRTDWHSPRLLPIDTAHPAL